MFGNKICINNTSCPGKSLQLTVNSWNRCVYCHI